jgi:energy-coupling factor transporter ATP-binding protein EcfA2
MSIVSYADLTGNLDKVRTGKRKMGYKFGHHKLDDHFQFKRGEFGIFLGHANVGKTTVVLYLMVLQSIKNGMTWLVFSTENTPLSIATKICEFYLGKILKGCDQAEMQKAILFMQGHFRIIDTESKMYTYRDLIDEADEQYMTERFDGFMIDPYNSLAKDRDMYRDLGGHEYDYEVATEFRNYCKDNKVSIWLCAHAVTESLRKKHPQGHEFGGHPIPCSMSDIEGGGKWGNRSDFFCVIHRYTMSPTDWMYSEIHVKKIKEVETGGKPTSLDFPIRMRSLPSNVGFEIGGDNLIVKKETKQGGFPF